MNTQIFWGVKKDFLKCLWLLFSFQLSPILSQKLPNLQCHCFHFLVFHLHFGKTFQVCLSSTALIQHSVVSTFYTLGFSLWLSSKESVCSARDAGDMVWSLDREGPLEEAMYSCQENSMDRRAWGAIAHRVADSGTGLKWLSAQSCSPLFLSCSLIQPVNFISLRLWIISFHWNLHFIESLPYCIWGSLSSHLVLSLNFSVFLYLPEDTRNFSSYSIYRFVFQINALFFFHFLHLPIRNM